MKTHPWMWSLACGCIAGSLQASTVAYWRFEEGSAGSNVDRNGQADGTYYGAITDVSGNGYNLSTWSDGGNAGYAYNSNVGGAYVNGVANNLSVRNTGGGPAMWTETGSALQTMTFATFTIEVSFKLENGGWRTIIGRDSQGAATINGDLAALYLQATPDNALAIKFADVTGVWHDATSATNIFTSFDFASDNAGDTAPWYSASAVSDGSTLSLYLRDVDAGGGWSLIASTDMTLSGSTDTTMTAGTGDGGDWDAGNFSIGRGLYGGGHGDRAYGFIDEVRISDEALTPSGFLTLSSVPEPSLTLLSALGGLALLRRRR
ncbi:hypothetical protein HNR46_002941 [Haloferula luteola]|uniref:PEP-CTERM protein-sorting domain-containing protein n=1 Tax=Haloferula luteola TaxID=595692 RepID=A0A840V521_9BACT|nr:hypothetical protein [Haloferula luteola]MBB5352693.1 hypothetical protein [Haloferula luteola]